MKKIVRLLVLLFGLTSLQAQLQKPVPSRNQVTQANIRMGIPMHDIAKNPLTTSALQKLKVPTINIEAVKKKAAALSTWKITPKKPRNGILSLYPAYYGEYSLSSWTLCSKPRVEGSQVTGWFSSYLPLKFRQTRGTEYRLTVKLNGSPGQYRGKNILVQNGRFAANYPIDPTNGFVNMVWTADRSADAHVLIFQLPAGTNPRRPAPETSIEWIKIDKL